MKKSIKTIIALGLVALTSVSAFAKSKAKFRTLEQIKKSGTKNTSGTDKSFIFAIRASFSHFFSISSNIELIILFN